MIMQAEILGLSPVQWDLVSAASNVMLTLGLLVFAALQWKVTEKQAELQEKAEATRIGERAADQAARDAEEDRALDRDFQIAWAEHFRLEGVANMYEKEDLLELSSLNVLDSSDLLPQDWSFVLASLGRLGVEAGFLGGVAVSLAHDAERQVALLNAVVNGFRIQYPNKGPGELAAMVRQNRGGEVKKLEERIRLLTRDLANLFWDAVSHSSRATVVRTLNFSDNMYSKLGKSAAKALQERQRAAEDKGKLL
jgi:hypothetical protein